MAPMDIDDEILAAFNNRDPQGWDKLYRQYHSVVLYYINGYVKYTPQSRIIAHDVFLKIYTNGKRTRVFST